MLSQLPQIIFAAVTFYVLLALAMYVFQRKLMYFPNKTPSDPAACGLENITVFTTQARDGVTLIGWHTPVPDNFPTLIYYHGNAANLGWRAAKFKAFTDAGFGLIAISYRGYGGSASTPTEAGLYEDARAALAYAADTLSIPYDQIILYGESMGTGVAIHMATEYAVKGLVLEAPYISVLQRSKELYPFMPVRLLIKDIYHSESKIAQVKAPLLLLHGEKDRVIPVHHGRKILELANEPKRGVFYPDIGHTNFDAKEIAKELVDFVSSVKK